MFSFSPKTRLTVLGIAAIALSFLGGFAVTPLYAVFQTVQ